jgi:4-azaleucine resistance transporter AzlC
MAPGGRGRENRRMSGIRHPSFRDGFRAGLPLAVASLALSTSFGLIAEPVIGGVEAIVMSAIVFAGSAQFAVIAVLAAGGGPIAAVAAGVLLNVRFLPMGIAIAPSLTHRPVKRAMIGQALIDFSWAAASRGEGRWDHRFMLGATAPNYPCWVGGTIIGVLAGGLIGDPERFGLDALFPAFFLALLIESDGTSSRRGAAAALIGGGLALALIPITPPGVPVIASCLGALVGLRQAPGEIPEATQA